MRTRTMLFFIAPSAVLMLVFIFAPLVSVAIQSLYTTTVVRETVKVETCSPGFLAQICTTTERSQVKTGPNGNALTETRFSGLESYRAVLEPEKVAAAFSAAGKGLADVLRLDFWRALRFTLMFTFVTLPLVVGLGGERGVLRRCALPGACLQVSEDSRVVAAVVRQLFPAVAFVDQGKGLLAPGDHLRFVLVVQVVLAVHRVPAVRLLGIHFDALAGLVHQADLDLRHFVTLLGGLAIPTQRAGVVEADAVTVLVNDRQVIGGVDVAFACPGFPDCDRLRGIAGLVEFRGTAQIVVGQVGEGGIAEQDADDGETAAGDQGRGHRRFSGKIRAEE